MEAGRRGRFYGDDRDFTPDYSKDLVPSVAGVEFCLWLYGFQSRDEIGFLVVQKVQDLPDGVYCPFEDDFCALVRVVLGNIFDNMGSSREVSC